MRLTCRNKDKTNITNFYLLKLSDGYMVHGYIAILSLHIFFSLDILNIPILLLVSFLNDFIYYKISKFYVRFNNILY